MEIKGSPTDYFRLFKGSADPSGKKGLREKSERIEGSGKTANSDSQPASKLDERRAFFAVDGGGNVVIRIVDRDGNLIKQIPPEAYFRMVEKLNVSMEHLMDIEA